MKFKNYKWMIMKKVLIIDDDKIVREPIKEYLTNMGYSVNVAKDGKDGIDMFRKAGNFDVVITDIEMPKMNGIAVAHLIRASEKSQTYIVAITGVFDPLLRKEMFDIVLPKPIPLERLAFIIESYFRKNKFSS
jgi:CheY-like chemotaxis protein